MKKKIALITAFVLSVATVAHAFFTVILNGQSYLIPAKGDTGYSQGVNSLDAFLQAIPNGLIQTSGGTMTGNLTLGTGVQIRFTAPNASVWPMFVDNNGNINLSSLSAGTTTFAIMNSTSVTQAGNPVIFVGSGTITNLNTTTLKFGDGSTQTSAGVALASTQTFTGSDSFVNSFSTFNVQNTSASINGVSISSAGAMTIPAGASFSGSVSFQAASIADSALSSNIALLNSTQAFSAGKTFSSSMTVQGAFGFVGMKFRRPGAVYLGTSASTQTTTEVNSWNGNQAETCLIFPDGTPICQSTTTAWGVWYGTNTVSLNAPYKSGMAPAEVMASNEWLFQYACKALDAGTTTYVIFTTTNEPTQANQSKLNLICAANSRYFLSDLRLGDQAGSSGGNGALLPFSQVADNIVFSNSGTSIGVDGTSGVQMANSGGATNISWAYATGFSGQVVPAHVNTLDWQCNSASAGSNIIENSAATLIYARTAAATDLTRHGLPASLGVACANSSSAAMSAVLQGIHDPLLSSPFGSPD